MSNARLEDLIKKKKIGDVWHSLEAHESLWFWNLKLPWDPSFFNDKGVQLLCVRVKASAATGKETKVTYTKSKPLILPSGIRIEEGYIATHQAKSGGATIRVDSIAELNESLEELSGITGLTQWEIRRMEVYNPDKGVTTEFKIHNPNCVKNGNKLSTFRFTNSEGSKLYPEVLFGSQLAALGSFCKTHTECSLKIPEEPKPEVVCAEKEEIPPQDIILRKKKDKNRHKI